MRAQVEQNFKFYPIILWILKNIMAMLQKMLVVMIDWGVRGSVGCQWGKETGTGFECVRSVSLYCQFAIK
jgi:hypothetical protein